MNRMAVQTKQTSRWIDDEVAIRVSANNGVMKLMSRGILILPGHRSDYCVGWGSLGHVKLVLRCGWHWPVVVLIINLKCEK